MNSLFKLFEILAWIIQSGRFDAKIFLNKKKIIIINKKNKKRENYRLPVRLVASFFKLSVRIFSRIW